MVNRFTILGERCSGTIFTEFALKQNFDLEYDQTINKHFVGYEEPTEEQRENVLYIAVVRHPIDWIDSFFKRLHHVPPANKRSITDFINNEWYSIHELGDKINTEIMEDRNMHTGQRYKDIFELRKTKIDYILETYSKQVKNFVLIRYEDMQNNYEETMDFLKNQFNLSKKNPENPYEKIIKYKGTYTALYFKKPILLPNEIQEEILRRVNKEQEEALGYGLD